MSAHPGIFITLEGGEGAGKTTHIPFIQKLLEDAGRTVCVTREPGGTLLGESVRNILLQPSDTAISSDTELLLMFAARAEHLHQVIVPALQRGEVVLCDRFTDATYAYQGGGRGIAMARIAELEQWTQQDLRPDLTLLFDVPVATGLERAGKRSDPDRFEQESNDFFQRVRQTYLDIAAKHPQRCKVVDAAADMAAVEVQITNIIAGYLES